MLFELFQGLIPSFVAGLRLGIIVGRDEGDVDGYSVGMKLGGRVGFDEGLHVG